MGANNVGKQAGQLGNVEAGQRPPRPDVARRIGVALRLSELEIREAIARDKADSERERRAQHVLATSDPRPRAYFKIGGLPIEISPPADVDPDDVKAVVAWAAEFTSESKFQAMVIAGEKTFCLSNPRTPSSASKEGEELANRRPSISLVGSKLPLSFDLTNQ